MLHKSKFRYYYTGTNTNVYIDDSTTIIQIIWYKCDLSTKLGVNTLKSKLLSFALDYFK